MAAAIGVDGNGNAIVTGSSYGDGTGSDLVTISYSPSGIPLWTNRYNGAANGNDGSADITVAANGTAVVTGYEIANSGVKEYVTLAYSAQGQPLWTNRYHGSVSYNDQPSAITMDTSGTAYVTGSSQLPIGGNGNYVTIAYSSGGVPLWTNRYRGPMGGPDQPKAIAVGLDGQTVFVTGSSPAASTSTDFATIAYGTNGIPLWTNRYNGPANGSDSAFGLTSAPYGLVVVGFSSSNAYYSIVTVRYVTTVPLAAVVTNSDLKVSWPSSHIGWVLQSQIADEIGGLGTNWTAVPASAGTNSVRFSLLDSQGPSFFRLVYLY